MKKPESNTHKNDKTIAANLPEDKLSTPDKSPRSPKFLVLLTICLLVVTVATGWLLWQLHEQHQQSISQFAKLHTNLQQTVAQLQQKSDTFSENQNLQSQQFNQMQQVVGDIQLQLGTHSRQLTELSATSRSDWRLAEALYLARLASQRLHTERSVENPLALLEQIDLILRQLADPQLLPVRAAIAEDITALRLANSVDRQGIYLELQALAKHIQALPLIDLAPQTTLPISGNVQKGDVREGDIENPPDTVAESFWQQFTSMIRIRRQATPIEPLLQPSEAVVLRRNLQMMLEQAQVALLREEQIIYRQSLSKVQDYLDRFFHYNSTVQRVEKRIIALIELEIVQQLPAINRTVEVLETLLIARQQRLTDIHKPAGESVEDSQVVEDGELKMESAQ